MFDPGTTIEGGLYLTAVSLAWMLIMRVADGISGRRGSSESGALNPHFNALSKVALILVATGVLITIAGFVLKAVSSG